MTALSALERRVVAEIARRERDLVDLLRTLVRFDTRVPDDDLAPRDEAALQEHLARRLRAAGLTVEVWEPDAAALADTRYPIPPGHHFRGRPQLLARAQGAGGGRSLLFNGHIDVITDAPRELWASDPFDPVIAAGGLVGRGACDMKGGVAAMVFATEVLRALEVGLCGDLLVNTVTDEESTGAGSLASVVHGARADGAIIPEPTSLSAWLGTRGSLLVTIAVEGRAGHAGYPHDERSPDAPVNAIEKLALVLEALVGLRAQWAVAPELRHPHLEPGRIVPVATAGGQWAVSYPAAATLSCHVQYLPQQADGDGWGTTVKREIEAHVLAATRSDPWLARHPPRLRWDGDVPPSYHAPDEPVCATTLAAAQALGIAPHITSRTTWFDGPTFSRSGTPALAFGPGDIRAAHTIGESIALDELVRGAQVLAVAAMRFCGVVGD